MSVNDALPSMSDLVCSAPGEDPNLLPVRSPTALGYGEACQPHLTQAMMI